MSEAPESEAPDTDDSQQASPLVVIGASAGSMDALLTLVSMLPTEFPAPIVVVQPVDPRRQEHVSGILIECSALPVRVVDEREELAVGVIHVVPANRDVEIEGRTLHVRPEPLPMSRLSIDRLLSTMARSVTSGVIAVVLDTARGDGAAGAVAVRAHGGTIIVQKPRTELLPGVPLSVPSSAVDFVVDLESIAPLLADLISGNHANPTSEQAASIRTVLDRVLERTGLDLALRERPIVTRHLYRRMAAVGTPSLEDYERHIDRHPEELSRLTSNVLFTATEFFRDSQLFTYLRDQILPPLLGEARERGELRIWSAGCATGEDAYTLAMMIRDLLGDDIERVAVKIFATDIATDALEFARRGVYPAPALNGLPTDLIDRHFLRVEDHHEVRKPVRSLIVFCEHDLGYRVPFPRIDLLFGGTGLMYFTPELQHRALQLFAFSLRSGGVLALGSSNLVNPRPEHFSVEQPQLGIFRRTEQPSPIPPDYFIQLLPRAAAARHQVRQIPLSRPSGLASESAPDWEWESPHGHQASRLLDRLTTGALIVDGNYHIRAINSAARRLLPIHGVGFGEDLIHYAPASLAVQLRAMLDAALGGESASTLFHVPDDVGAGDDRDLLIAVYPMTAADRARGEAVVEVIDVTSLACQQRGGAAERDQLRELADREEERAKRAVDEVRRLRQANQVMADESARLRAANEELLVASEEAYAAAEEIETLNEELQATNEELETLSEELQATIEELTTTNDELELRTVALLDVAAARETEQQRLEAILTAMRDAVIVVASDGKPLLTNAAYDQLFSKGRALLPEDDLGQPMPEALWPQRRAAKGESFTLPFTMRDRENGRRWFEALGQPLLLGGVRQGGVIVIRDVSDRSLRRIQEQFLATAGHELRTPLTALSLSLDLAARRGARFDDDRLRLHIQRALEQARRLSALVVELVDVVRLQTSTLQIQPELIDLNEPARAAIETARIIAVDQPIALHSEGPIMVSADPRRIEQVLLNLLVNAVTFAPSSEPIEVSLQYGNGTAEFEVRDKGPGIPAEALPHIFERFFQVVREQSAGDGLGLGLFIAREIVTAHGGTIEATSQDGAGARFVVRLPLSEVTERADETRHWIHRKATL